MSGKIKVTLVKSLIGETTPIKATVKGLGIKKINQTVELENTPAVRGMIKKVIYLLKLN